MEQQPQESTSDPEAPAVEVQPSQESKARPPRRRRLTLILSALAILLLVGVSQGLYLVIMQAQRPHAPTTGARLTPTAPKTLAERWRVVDSPTAGQDSTWLSKIAASSSDDAWALGTDIPPGHSFLTSTPLLLHWDGQGWKPMAVPHDQHTSLNVTSITALSPDNAWLVGSAVGTDPRNSAGYRCFLMHWDGHQWSQTPAPLVQHQFCELDDITALSPTDIWAVGSSADLVTLHHSGSIEFIKVSQTLIEHWDGQQWSVVPAPSPGADRWLTQITASAANDIWTIGFLSQHLPSFQPNAPAPPLQALIEHWDGHQWSVVQSPSPDTETLSDITAVAPNDVWAVGHDTSTDGGGSITMHWDGQHWSAVSSPTLPGHPQETALDAMAALGPDDIWAVGSSIAKGTDALPQTAVHLSQMLLEHWDGQQWSIVAVQAPGQGSALYGLVRVPTTSQMWAVGGWSQSKDPTTPTTTLTLLMA